MAKKHSGGRRASGKSTGEGTRNKKKTVSGGGGASQTLYTLQGNNGYNVYRREGNKEYINGYRVHSKPPEGFKLDDSAYTPNGFQSYTNGASRFGGKRVNVLVKAPWFKRMGYSKAKPDGKKAKQYNPNENTSLTRGGGKEFKD